MRLPEYDRLDALALADLVRRREVTALELLEAALERADARNPALNAIVARYDDEARRRAAGPLPAGPLSGVPFLLKDLLAAWKGHPLTGSSRLLDGFVPAEDSEVVRRLEGAGLVLFGQTNTPELGILGTTEPALRGPTRNPWAPARSAGGSSGGSAAAIAADRPGRARQRRGRLAPDPASACGIFGLKPTRGRVSLGPRSGQVFSGLTVEGAMTRSVRDAAALLDVLAGAAPGDPYTAPPPARPFSVEVGTAPGRLRIAVTHESFFGKTTAPECREAVLDAARLLASLGHDVVEARPQFPREALVHAYIVALAATTAADVALAARATGRRPGPASSSSRPGRSSWGARCSRRGTSCSPSARCSGRPGDGRVLRGARPAPDAHDRAPAPAARRDRGEAARAARAGPRGAHPLACAPRAVLLRGQRPLLRGDRVHDALQPGPVNPP